MGNKPLLSAALAFWGFLLPHVSLPTLTDTGLLVPPTFMIFLRAQGVLGSWLIFFLGKNIK